MNRTRVPRYRGGLAGTLLLSALGLLYAEPRLFAAAVVPLGYVAFGAVSSLSGATTPSVERALDSASPPPGAEVEVTLTVRNEGDSPLSDVRVVDGVPDELAVIEGSPRGALALRPDEEKTISYSVVAKPGDYEFDDPTVRVRTASATDRVTTAVSVGGDATLSCSQAVADPPFAEAAPRRVGTHATDSGGDGIEFHSTREYRPGDPLSRIDWRGLAKTGELTTVRFREERAARTVVVVDARPVARTTPSAGYPNGGELSAYAGERLYDALTGASVATSVTAVGLADEDWDGGLPADNLPWAASDGVGSARLVFEAVGRAADRDEEAPTDETGSPPTLGSGVGGSPSPGDSSTAADPSTADGATADSGSPADSQIRQLLARLPTDAQVVVVSPLLDDWPVSLVRSLSVRGHDCAVLSPDVTGGRASGGAVGGDTVGSGAVGGDAVGGGPDAGKSPGQAVAATHRAVRLWDLRTTGATTIDWDVTDPLGVALEQTLSTILYA